MTRLRLLSLQTPAGRFDFDGGLACVHTEPTARSAVAAAIARAVIGPRSADVEGTLDIAGRYVALQSLPAPLLRPSAPATVDRSMLDHLWHRTAMEQRAGVQAAHAARRLERHRTEAAIEWARARVEKLERRTEPVAPAVLVPEPEPEPEVVDEVTPRLAALVAALGDLSPVPSPDALSLAAAFERLAATPPPAPAEPIEVDLAQLEGRVADARIAVADAAGGVLPGARTRIEQCHRAVVETERTLFEAGRKERPDALAAYQQALGAERAALAEAGVDSYASFLVAIAAGAAPVDLEARLRAELQLAQAEGALNDVRASSVDDGPGEIEQRELELRARAAQLLGHFPGSDPAAELRVLRVEHPDAAELRQELAHALASIGVDAGTDVVGVAVTTMRERQEAPPRVAEPAAPVAAPEPPTFDPEDDAERRELAAEMHALLEGRAGHEAALVALEAQLETLDQQRALSFPDDFDADSVTLGVAYLLDRYREAELLAGRLPLVLDGVFDDLGASRSAVVANHLAAIDDVQVIVVTSDLGVADAFAVVGAATRSWPEAATEPPESEVIAPMPTAPPLVPVAPALDHPPIVTMCQEHPGKVAATSCGQCSRPSCVDCLVYMPDTADLWCVTCAEATGRRDLRLLGRA